MKSTVLFVCVLFAYCACFVASAPTFISAPFVGISVPHIIGAPHVAVDAPFTHVGIAHPRSHIAYPGLSYGYSSYYPSYYPTTYYSSVHPFSSVHIG